MLLPQFGKYSNTDLIGYELFVIGLTLCSCPVQVHTGRSYVASSADLVLGIRATPSPLTVTLRVVDCDRLRSTLILDKSHGETEFERVENSLPLIQGA